MAAQISTKPLISMGQRLGMVHFLGMPQLWVLLGRPWTVEGNDYYEKNPSSLCAEPARRRSLRQEETGP